MDFSTDFDETLHNEKFDGIDDGNDNVDFRFKRIRLNDELDTRFGYVTYKESAIKIAWLLNMHPAEIFDEDKRLISVVNYYFIEDDGSRFKISLPFQPYFYVAAKIGCDKEVSLYLTKKYSSLVTSVQIVEKEDLDLPNHLIGLKRAYLKLNFLNVNNLLKVRRELMPRIRKNREKEKSSSGYTDMLINHLGGENSIVNDKKFTDQVENIIDIREYDVPYHVRVSIDLKIFVGHWYNVCGRNCNRLPEIIKNHEVIDRPDPIVLAFDIETTKSPLKFPDSQVDQIIMISYMIDTQGYLIVNREIVSADVEDFEYTPRPEYEGPFQVFNESNEYQVLVRFFEHVRNVRPHIFVTYNGDFFDWPFIETRAATYGLYLRKEIGFEKDSQGEYKSPQCIHMDAFKWVKRDSYLPMGSQGLKACTKAKLRYDPVELDPELMCDMAKDQPRVLANYSVSDAVATYYLYMKYVHPFIFALCTIIPMEPDEVLRKGSGTLCEALLMVEAFHCNIIFPNKEETEHRKMTDDGHLIESETYVGGHVEALESGIFRSDIPCRFRLTPSAFDDLLSNLERTMRYAVEIEDVRVEDLTDFNQKCDSIRETLEKLRDCPNRLENPLIYHLDVAAMYPNIILTNRLQPPAIIKETVCAACDFNRPGAKCQRKMEWMWRSEILPANRSEYQRIIQQLENEKFPSNFPNGSSRAFHQLPKDEQIKIEKKRLQDYCRRAYRRVRETRTELCETMICQRENSFYVDTVKAFRDRRYEYKNLLKNAKKKLDAASKGGDASEIKSCKAKEILYDSLQLAHKCILNSFYGYVMRKGSRWFSMEMAGIVCYTGAQIIMKSKELVEKIGRPLELDTDGIWCALPGSFPENVTFSNSDPKRPFITISYPGSVLNIMVRDAYTNNQYHTLIDQERKLYKIHSENSIAFEVDGPYKAMVLPAAKEEGKKLKKRYAVFNFDGSLAELKGFEVKRRGELQLIKIFQSSVFDAFLKGTILEEVYQSVAKVADYWLDVLYSKAADMPDSELFELLSENRSLSKKLEDYGAQKSTSITVAKRLAEFLGDQMVKDAGLACKIIIAKEPVDCPVTERALPMIIFQAEGSVRRHYLRKWLKNSNLASYDIRDILDWSYYIERLGSAIQKIITIPAALQGIPNPVPRVAHPDWLHKRLLAKNDVMKQKRITEIFHSVEKSKDQLVDLEDICQSSSSRARDPVATMFNRKRTASGGNKLVSHSKTSKSVENFERSWRDVLGKPPPFGSSTASQQIWLSFMKKKWAYQKKQREERKITKRSAHEHTAGNLANVARPPTATGIGGFVQKSARALSEMPWQILQIAKTNEPGLFNVWLMVGNDLRSIKLRVPRIFYINLKVAKNPENTEVYKKVHRVLPRSNTEYFLYKYQVPEDQFQQNVNDMTAELSAPEVEGIYETQIPLLFRIFTELGCVCRLSNEHRKAYLETEIFDFNQLEFLSLSQTDYLEENNFKQLFLYHYSQDARAIWALFNLTSKKVEIWFLDKGKNANVPNLTNLYNSERNSKFGKVDEIYLPEADYAFQVNSCANLKEICRNIQRSVRAYKDEKRGSTFISFISSLETENLTNLMPSLTDFPLIKLRIGQQENMFSALDWQRVGCRSMIVQFLNFPTYFQNYLDLCRYLHMPLGNVPKDFASFGADLFFARYLQRQNHILWCSPTDRPDFGGKEVDDNRLMSDFFESQELNLNQPGFYTSCCVELDVASLPIAALLQSQKITEEEGVSAAVGFDVGQQQIGIDEMINSQRGLKILAGYDEAAFCAHTFRFLKSIVHGWVKDLANFSNKFADNLIVHFYRWLRSNTSYMYEPALKKIVNALMKKLFLLLVADLKRLGAVIVHATLSKIIICTKKRNDADAATYVEFVLQTINKKDLFSPLDITVRQTWRVLLWLDPANLGGIKVNSDDVSIENEEVVDMNWNLMHFLPVVGECQTNFDEFVAGYIWIVYKQIKKELENTVDCELNSSVSSSLNESTLNTTQAIVKNEKINENLTKFCQSLVASELTPKLASFVQKLQRKIMVAAGDIGVAEMFPNLPGSHLKLTNPALEFAKSVCKVISLDANVDDEAENMRRTVLKCLGVGEFSPEAEWQDPCLSYVLPEFQVICRQCNRCRDVDLCRDTYIFEKGKELSRWRCDHCNKEYNLNEIEQILIQHSNKWMMSYCLQDLKCEKCRMIKQAHMNSNCECSGNFSPTISSENLIKTFRAFSNLARCYRMMQLHEALRFLAALCPQLKVFL